MVRQVCVCVVIVGVFIGDNRMCLMRMMIIKQLFICC